MAWSRAKKQKMKTFAIWAAALLALYYLVFKTSKGQNLVAKISDTLGVPKSGTAVA